MPSERGWTRVTPAKNGEEFFVNTFLEGVIERRRVADGQVVARHDIGRKCALCGVAEVCDEGNAHEWIYSSRSEGPATGSEGGGRCTGRGGGGAEGGCG